MKTPLPPSVRPPNHSGFSLFEVLMFIAVLGIMLGILVPMLNVNDTIYSARDRRNAQELSSVSVMAQAAGLDFVQETGVIETVRAIVRGERPARGAMKGRIFVVPGLSEEDIKGAAKYLSIQDGELRYTNNETVLEAGHQSM